MCNKYTRGMAAIEAMTEHLCEETTGEGNNQKKNNEEAASDKPVPKTVGEEFRTMITSEIKELREELRSLKIKEAKQQAEILQLQEDNENLK